MPAGALYTAEGRVGHWFSRRMGCCLTALLALLLQATSLLGAPKPIKQFDVFLGYDNVVTVGAWAPFTFEMLNEGPTFKGTLVIKSGGVKSGTLRKVPIELPTGTRKRLCVPVFMDSYYGGSWDVLLYDESGALREERRDIRPRIHLSNENALMGALPKTVGGMPSFAEVNRLLSRYQPVTARLSPELFPDHPLALEGLTAFYLHAEKAAELREAQVRALLAWVHQGGHFIVGLHAPSDLQGAPWLQRLLPFAPNGMEKMDYLNSLASWIRASHPRLFLPPGHDQAVQPGFEEVPLPDATPTVSGGVVLGEVTEGRVMAESKGRPLMITAKRGRGLLTVLTFAPETEPFRSWPHRRHFFAKLLEINPLFFYQGKIANPASVQIYHNGFIDGIMGQIIDSRQIRQLPLGWMVVLLMGYLVVIGPVDYFLLRRLKRPMLTWITFPAYVAMFSALIYWVGYKLRAGEMEWNEVHVADVHPREQGGAQLRAWNFIGAYAPANVTYQVASSAPVASLRDEYRVHSEPGIWSQKRTEVSQEGDTFKGALSIPVWTSQRYVEEYLQAVRQTPISATVMADQGNLKMQIRNHLSKPLACVWVFSTNGVDKVLNINPGQTVILPLTNKMTWAFFRTNQLDHIHPQSHTSHDDGDNSPVVKNAEEWVRLTAAASFPMRTKYSHGTTVLLAPPQFNLNPCLQRGDIVVMAAVEDHLPKPSLLKSSKTIKRGFGHTVYRLVIKRPLADTPAATPP
ncbi:hypothetical protein NXS98_05910 [Fontisphaera persica]|uniref:hypothetical protein n=1 Tax=Fontisphaera persica TaxID=2974023 RepID=UPI0024BFCAC3|nr:hypothetical protein [Fontisphaera persica]WCJ60660.1 hypothetical protein NXS98_05910 [Fontisphaera persica]